MTAATVTMPDLVASASAAAPAMVLGCLTGARGAARYATAWQAAFAPELRLCLVDADSGDIAVAAGRQPYALIASGGDGVVAVRLAQGLLARGAGPAQLLLCQCATPVPLPTPIACKLTVFAEAGLADAAAGWRASCTGDFTLRVLSEPAALPPAGPVSAELVLAIKEEIGAWPH